jgi:hypothetical protein
MIITDIMGKAYRFSITGQNYGCTGINLQGLMGYMAPVMADGFQMGLEVEFVMWWRIQDVFIIAV